MKTLIQKELRENLKLALPGLLILSALLLISYRHSETLPFLSNNILGVVELFCNGFGLALGWFQISHERHRDLRAFLIHRPLSRTRIFFAKIIAGFGLYTLVAGLPLLVWVAASGIPGHFASPFEWAMALPVVGDFLMGMVWYFAGMLTGLRHARWYVSRGLGLVAALFIYMLLGTQWRFGIWQPFVVIAIGGIILAVAAWGAFQGDGSDRSQPAWGRRALAATLALALVLVAVLAHVQVESLLLRGHQWDSSYPEIMQDGTICRVIQRVGQPSEIVNPDGVPLKDPDNGRKLTLAGFDKLVAESYPINVEFGDQSELRNHFRSDSRFFCLWQTVDRINWYWTRDGKLAGYDTATRRLAGTIVPDNFPGPPARFLRPQLDAEVDPDGDSGPQGDPSALILATPLTVCRVNLEDSTNNVLSTTTAEDPIGGARNIGDQAFVVVTRSFIQMMTMDGRSVWKVPYKSAYPASMWVKVSKLAGPEQFAVWVGPYGASNKQNSIEGRDYPRIFFVSAKQGLLKRVNVPSPPSQSMENLRALSWRMGLLLMPPLPVFYQLLGWQNWQNWRAARFDMEWSLWTALPCALIGWGIGRRYHFPMRTQLGWAVFHLVFGVPGFIAFLCVQDWPVRVPCTKCKKMRIVEHTRCEHCEAGFASPEKNGTEIFEQLTAQI